jgi:hypothetical protein
MASRSSVMPQTPGPAAHALVHAKFGRELLRGTREVIADPANQYN